MRRPKTVAGALLACVACIGLAQTDVKAANFWPARFYDQLVHDGSQITQPTSMAFDAANNMYVAQRDGLIRVKPTGSTSFSDFTRLSVNTGGERGLLGVVIERNTDPTRSFLYALHNDLQSKMTVTKINLATRASAVLYTSPNTFNFFHNGGGIDLDTLGHVFFALGDNYLPTSAQDLTTETGKVHRINTDGSIPADNPYATSVTALRTIYAAGFRNPFRLDVDRQNNDVFVGDVGSTVAEEINKVRSGKNYGWPSAEGGTCNVASCAVFEAPFYFYNHWTGNSITGGPVYRADVYPPSFQGRVFFADWSVGIIDTLDSQSAGLANFSYNSQDIVDLEIGADGYLYTLNYFFGKIHKVVYNTNDAPLPPQGTVSCTITGSAPPSTATCAVTKISDPNGDDVTVTWKVNGVAAGTGTALSKSLPTAGTYQIDADLSDGALTTTLRATPIVIGTAPVITELPTNPTEFAGGMNLNFGFSATDANGATIPPSQCSIRVQISHNDHVHDLDAANACIYSGQVPRNLETEPGIRLKVTMRATDAGGLASDKVAYLSATTSTLTLASYPIGANITLDGQNVSGPITGTAGLARQLNTPEQFEVNGKVFLFSTWSDGVATASRDLNFPSSPTTLTAMYRLDTSVGSKNNLFVNASFESLTNDFADSWMMAQRGQRVIGLYSFNGQGRTGHGCRVTVAFARFASAAYCHQSPFAYDSTKLYTFSNWYKSSVPSATYALFTNRFGLSKVRFVGYNAPSTSWQRTSLVIEPEADATNIKVYQSPLTEGVLYTDEYFLSSTS